MDHSKIADIMELWLTSANQTYRAREQRTSGLPVQIRFGVKQWPGAVAGA
jgi:hypothetical protein